MSRKYAFLALFAGVILWLASSMNPPNGETGAPGEGLCSDCHTLNGGTQNGSIVLTGLPASIMPNTMYLLTITNSNPNGVAVKGGFQITILNSSNMQAGNMTNPSANSTISSSGGRQYWEHNPAQNYPGNNMLTWTVTWTSPAGPMGTTITAYCAGNVANGNNQSTGDLIVTSQSSGMLEGGGTPLSVTIINSANVTCFGGSNGSATAMASGGVPPYTYNWSNGGSGAMISNLPAGIYTVTVTDNASSTATDNVTITQPPNLILQNPSITNVSCNGGSNGSITASATGGVPPYAFNWSNGNNGATISNLAAGSYTVTVTDDNNCTKMATYMVTQPPLLVINLINLEDESCAGENDGSITISATGGVMPYFIEWSNGFIGNSITDLEPGVYDVTVTDNNDCTKTASYTIDPGGTVMVELVTLTHVTCPGGSDGSITIMASGGVMPYTYAWSNGGNTATISNIPAGNYLSTVTDANGCENVSFYVVNQPPAITIDIMQTGSNLCFGDTTVTLTANPGGGTPPFTGMWSNGESGFSNANLGAGTYTITVTDSKGCTSTASSTVTQPPQVTVSVTTTDETGAGANDGTATATPAGGTPMYSYLWSNGGNTAMITGLAPGTYTVTVTDMNGCSKTGSGQVDAFGCTLDAEVPDTITICEGDTTEITVMVTGASGVATYSWSTGDTTSSILVSAAGNYCVTVTDEAACEDNDCIVVNVQTIPDFNCPVTNESAPDQNDGAIGCDTIPGAISYLWSNGATTPMITGLTPGVYCLTVTDAMGCTKEECFTVQPGNCQLVITSIINDLLCAGDTDGSISVMVDNATPPVSYLWSNADTTSVTSNLAAGNYSVTIGDAAGCTEIRSYTVTEPPALTITVDSVQDISAIPGMILITVAGGVPPYNYLWTDPLGSMNTDEDQNFLTVSGTYSVVVTDANGCTVENDSINVDVIDAVRPDLKPRAVKVYPVPVTHTVYIDFDAPIKQLYMIGVDGRTILHERNKQDHAVDLSSVEPGWYLLRFTDGEYWYYAKVVK